MNVYAYIKEAQKLSKGSTKIKYEVILNLKSFLCVYMMCTYEHMHAIGICMEVRGQLCGVASLLTIFTWLLGITCRLTGLHAKSYPTKTSH